ncbi:hypothetical protein M9Y10_022233 [Tritrichomonas musculus]|uniref:Uncharacterized protein n=1 Tax=Tritrichomonas musculus TaxID=1915356 RepID=A0ABR2KRP0_9EUKA
MILEDNPSETTEKYVPPMTQSEGISGKFIKRIHQAYDRLTGGRPINRSREWKEKVDKFKNWAWDNKGEILRTGGEIMDVVADTTGNKYFKGGAKIMKATGNGIQNIENNEAQKLIDQMVDERNKRLFGNKYVAYSDFPRIHYSRKPVAYKIYQGRNKYVDEAEAKLARLKKQREYNQIKSLKKAKRKRKGKK